MANDNEVEREAIKEYGEQVGLIYMLGYMKGKVQGHREAVQTYEEFDKSSGFVPDEVDLTELESNKTIIIKKIKV